MLIVVTMNCGDDWNVHLGLADYYFDNFKNLIIMKSGFIDVADNLYPFTPIIYEDVIYPIKDDEKVKVEVYLFTKTKCEKIGYFRIYLNSKIVRNVDIYRYY